MTAAVDLVGAVAVPDDLGWLDLADGVLVIRFGDLGGVKGCLRYAFLACRGSLGDLGGLGGLGVWGATADGADEWGWCGERGTVSGRVVDCGIDAAATAAAPAQGLGEVGIAFAGGGVLDLGDAGGAVSAWGLGEEVGARAGAGACAASAAWGWSAPCWVSLSDATRNAGNACTLFARHASSVAQARIP